MSFAIKLEEKEARLTKIRTFEQSFGRGDVRLSKEQIKARIGKILGSDADKIRGFGKNKEKGVKLFTKADNAQKVDMDSLKDIDPIPSIVLDDLENYPNDPYRVSKDGKSKVLNIDIKNDGTLIMEGICINGKERDPKIRSKWNLISASDIDSARSELLQFKKGELKEVSDRTMAIHRDNGNLDLLLDAADIDTDEDKEMQY